ncbi:MAG: hypothetical protein D6815_06435 [Candidatus Dadabacteria bacterium]|nr:MAG: hypothetical protein D6815_06435 [Candidatus Dadabacteria bacterium]
MRARALAIAALLACSACHSGKQRPDILLITVDTLRPDHLSFYGYGRPTSPNLDARLERCLVFTRAYTTEASTPPSVVSILTGLLPQQHRLRLFFQLFDAEVPTIPELLPPEYQTAAFVSNMVLTNEAIGLASRFDHYDDYVSRKQPLQDVWERNARDTTNAVLAWLATEADPKRPLFLWVHYMDPHGPYRPPDHWKRSFRHSGSRPISPELVPEFHRQPGVTDGLDYVDAYDEEIAYTDSEIGRLLEGFDRRRSLDKALFVFSADHGEAMMEHEHWFIHGYHVYDEIARVPLAICGPGVPAGTRDDLVSVADIAPTILRYVGVEPPAQAAGIDLLAMGSKSAHDVVFVEATAVFQASVQRRSAVTATGKWIAEIDTKTGKIARTYFYDLARDPLELTRRPWPDGPPARRLRELIASDPDKGGIPERYRKGIELKAPKVAPGLPRETLERLRALGYVR